MPPTLRQVAAAAGVHHTTLSRALRGHPDVSAAKTKELRALAEKMGYVPDPMLRALAAYRTGRRPMAFHSVIAYINPTAQAADARQYRTYRNFLDATEQRACELGFRLELISIAPMADTIRINSMLKARNITGVIVGPVTESNRRLEMIDWTNLSAVRLGQSITSPRLHTVAPERSNAMRMLMDELIARGYRRPGLLLASRVDRNTDTHMSSAFLRNQLRLARRDRLPPRLTEGHVNEGMPEWIARHRPDAIIVMGDEKIPPLLRRHGWRIPEDLGLAVMVQPNEGPMMSGMEERGTMVGVAAVDFLVAMMNRQERGVPAYPQTLLINSEWIDGGTLRPREETAPTGSV